MNILWITLESVLPANTGGRIGVFKRIEQLSKFNQIFLFYPYDNQEELAEVEKLKRYCKEVHPYYRKDNLYNALKMINKYPYTVGSRCIKEMQQDIMSCINKNSIDILNVDFPHMCANLVDLDINIPIVLNEHNLEWKVYRKISISQKNLLKKIAYFIDSYRLKAFEKSVLNKIPIKGFTFVSDEDMTTYIKEHCIDPRICFHVPIGSDVRNEYSVTNTKEEKKIIFVGKMSYGPNIEAAIHFVNDVFPRIRVIYPKSKFYIVGRDPVDELLKLQSESIIVTGAVDSVEPYYLNADLVVLPLLNGGGAKIKLLEAISYKRPIVSTSIGVEGTVFRCNHTIAVCDDDNKFAAQCLEYLSDNTAANIVAERAYEVFCDGYSWNSIGKSYQMILESVSH